MWVRPSAEDLTRIGVLVDRGALRIELARSVPLDGAVGAYRLSGEGHGRGKTAVRTP